MLEGHEWADVVWHQEIGFGAAPSGKSGDFDRIYLKENEGKYQIFEVKGGSSELGSRMVTRAQTARPGMRVQQGSSPYLVDIVLNMAASKDKGVASIGDRLLQAIKDTEVDYLYFQQGFKGDGTFAESVMKQFDISDILNYLPE